MVRYLYPFGLVEQALGKTGPHARESDDDILEFTRNFYNESVALNPDIQISRYLPVSRKSVSTLIPREFERLNARV